MKDKPVLVTAPILSDDNDHVGTVCVVFDRNKATPGDVCEALVYLLHKVCLQTNIPTSEMLHACAESLTIPRNPDAN